VYRTVNEVLDTAQEFDCSAVAFEDLRSFRALLHGLRLYRKSLGYAYLAAQKAKETEKALRLLRRIREVKKQIKLLQALPWGRFRDDLQVEAKWRGIRTVAVRAAGTSVTCPRCGNSSKENRKGRGFRCTKCGFQMQANLLAALNIAVRGAERLLEGEKKNK
jgi:transposase